MALTNLLSLAEKIDFVATAITTGEAFTDANTALELSAVLGQIVGCGVAGGPWYGA